MFIVLATAHLVAAFCLAWLANWLGLMPWRRAAGAHWTERARLLWPARKTAALNLGVIPLILNVAHSLAFPATPQPWVITWLLGFLGALVGAYPLDREIHRQLHFRLWLHQAVALWGFGLGTVAALVAAIVFMPEEPGWRMLAVAGGYLVFHAAVQWGLFTRYLRWVKYLTPAEERLQRIVDDASARAGVRPRATWTMGGVHALAFAYPTTRELAFSRRLLETCSDEEISAICAHEVAHLTESKAVLAGRLLGSMSLFPMIFIIPAVHRFGPFGILAPLLGFLLASRCARWFSLRMEKRADRIGAGSQLNEGVYARALEKIYRENHLPAVSVNNRQTHPHLYDRMLAAGISPDYPRPARAKRMTWVGMTYIVVLVTLFVMDVIWGEWSP